MGSLFPLGFGNQIQSSGLRHRPLTGSVTSAALLLQISMLSLPEAPSLSSVCDEILSEVDFYKFMKLMKLNYIPKAKKPC